MKKWIFLILTTGLINSSGAMEDSTNQSSPKEKKVKAPHSPHTLRDISLAAVAQHAKQLSKIKELPTEDLLPVVEKLGIYKDMSDDRIGNSEALKLSKDTQTWLIAIKHALKSLPEYNDADDDSLNPAIMCSINLVKMLKQGKSHIEAINIEKGCLSDDIMMLRQAFKNVKKEIEHDTTIEAIKSHVNQVFVARSQFVQDVERIVEHYPFTPQEIQEIKNADLLNPLMILLKQTHFPQSVFQFALDSFNQEATNAVLDHGYVQCEDPLFYYIEGTGTAARLPLHHICSKLNQSKDGKNPLTDFVMYFLKKGADINQKEGAGFTPVALALAIQNDETAKMLIEQGANVLLSDNKQRNVLHLLFISFAAQLGESRLYDLKDQMFEIFKPFFDILPMGELVNQPDADGFTPLHWATRIKNTQSVRMLVEKYNGDITKTNNSGLTCLGLARNMCASDRNMQEIVDYLEAKENELNS